MDLVIDIMCTADNTGGFIIIKIIKLKFNSESDGFVCSRIFRARAAIARNVQALLQQ